MIVPDLIDQMRGESGARDEYRKVVAPRSVAE